MQFRYSYGEWQTAAIVLDSLANGNSIASTGIDFKDAAGLEWELNVNGTAGATAYFDVVLLRGSADSFANFSTFENGMPLNSVFFSATPTIAIRYNESFFDNGKLAVKNNTGQALGGAGNTLRYRLIYPISLSV